MTLKAVFPDGFTAQLFVIRSPFHLFRVHADNFFYFDEKGERQHICTHSVESWARIHGVQIFGSKFSQVKQNNEEATNL
ncbi:TPA: hypothetical protein JI393_RS14375 [Acinetobacter baumannii]|uniref:hypothetical protein n=1 Tax=Acinetobacter indicus TaxID=756892 RepID=UPI000CEB94E9|nr:hypothetical protein [Acinetobacter indicus]HBI1384564.1 hypothetical protein [Acinetobacter baumannii]HBI9064022.1 hypothetical protein [Acinetobacter baumannii]